MTYWSGVWATAVLLAALAVTPALTIFLWKRLIDLRRMIGVAALAYTLAHMVIYFALRFWNFALIAKETAGSPSLILATLSTVGLVALGITSFDAAILRMGAKGWQRLHGTVYVVSLLALLHGTCCRRGTSPMQYLLAGIFWLMIWRLLERYGRGTDPKALAVLAVGSCLFTALLEVAWIWARRGYAPVGRSATTPDLRRSAGTAEFSGLGSDRACRRQASAAPARARFACARSDRQAHDAHLFHVRDLGWGTRRSSSAPVRLP